MSERLHRITAWATAVTIPAWLLSGHVHEAVILGGVWLWGTRLEAMLDRRQGRVTVNVHGSTISEEELVRLVHEALLRKKRKGDDAGL